MAHVWPRKDSEVSNRSTANCQLLSADTRIYTYNIIGGKNFNKRKKQCQKKRTLYYSPWSKTPKIFVLKLILFSKIAQIFSWNFFWIYIVYAFGWTGETKFINSVSVFTKYFKKRCFKSFSYIWFISKLLYLRSCGFLKPDCNTFLIMTFNLRSWNFRCYLETIYRG